MAGPANLDRSHTDGPSMPPRTTKNVRPSNCLTVPLPFLSPKLPTPRCGRQIGTKLLSTRYRDVTRIDNTCRQEYPSNPMKAGSMVRFAMRWLPVVAPGSVAEEILRLAELKGMPTGKQCAIPFDINIRGEAA